MKVSLPVVATDILSSAGNEPFVLCDVDIFKFNNL